MVAVRLPVLGNLTQLTNKLSRLQEKVRAITSGN